MMIVHSTPIAMIAATDTCRIMLLMLPSVRKFGRQMESAIQRAMVNAITYVSTGSL